MGDDEHLAWYSGPIPPASAVAYLDWLVIEHDGDLIEARYSSGADAYHVEVTALEAQPDGTYCAVTGANVDERDGGGGPDHDVPVEEQLTDAQLELVDDTGGDA